MRGKLPFVGRIFWKVLAIVVILVVLIFAIFIVFTDYELTRTDVVGSLISLLILSYLVHLWLLPGEHAQSYDEPAPHGEPAPYDEPQPEELRRPYEEDTT